MAGLLFAVILLAIVWLGLELWLSLRKIDDREPWL